jgi:hypothetical protein
MSGQRTASVRLGSFALILLGTFGTAYSIGERLPGHHHAAGAGHTHTHSASPVAPGFEMNGFQLITEKIDGDSETFHLRDPNGNAVTEFSPSHGALLHAVLIRPDLSDFQHVHPDIDGDGSWTVTITAPGKWHLVFESVPVVDGVAATQPIIVTANVDDETVVATVPLPAADDVVEVDGLVVTRNGFLFTVTNADGTAATGLEPYLEQVAHLVAIRQADLAYTHLHPMDSSAGTFDFGKGLTAPGTYRLFLQFGHSGSVLTVPFTVVIP